MRMMRDRSLQHSTRSALLFLQFLSAKSSYISHDPKRILNFLLIRIFFYLMQNLPLTNVKTYLLVLLETLCYFPSQISGLRPRFRFFLIFNNEIKHSKNSTENLPFKLVDIKIPVKLNNVEKVE